MQQSFETPTSHFFQSFLSFFFPHISNSGESCLVNYMHIERMTCIQMVMHGHAKVGHRKNLGDWWGLAEVQFQQWINVALRIFFFFLLLIFQYQGWEPQDNSDKRIFLQTSNHVIFISNANIDSALLYILTIKY